MSIADEVRAEHPKCTCGDCNVPRCQGCFEDYPCQPVRLADSHDALLRAAEALAKEHSRDGIIICAPMPVYGGGEVCREHREYEMPCPVALARAAIAGAKGEPQ